MYVEDCDSLVTVSGLCLTTTDNHIISGLTSIIANET